MFKFIFGDNKKIISNKRKQVLDGFRKQAIKALNELAKKSKDDFEKNLYYAMQDSINGTPIHFYPKTSLRGKVYRAGGKVFSSVTMGENVKQIRVIQYGNRFYLQSKAHINFPSERLFSGDSLTLPGVFTLSHEYAHFPKPGVKEFAFHNNMTLEQAEEFLSDMLAAKLSKQLGFSHAQIVSQLHGREIVYGGIPFKQMIMKALK